MPNDADRAADLEKRIGFLEGDTFAIPGRADEFAQRAQDFRSEQGQLSGNVKEAHGHDYAAGLALDLAAYKESAGNHDAAVMLTKEANGRQEIAEALRGEGGPTNYPPQGDTLDETHVVIPGPLTDGGGNVVMPRQAPDTPAELAPDQPSEAGRAGNRYDALRQSEVDARALSTKQQEQDLAHSKGEQAPGETIFVDYDRAAQEVEEALKDIVKSAGGNDEGPALNSRLSHNQRVDVQDTPQGTATVSAVKNSDPVPEGDLEPKPIRPEVRIALERMQPMHPDDHAARIEAAGLAYRSRTRRAGK